MSFTQVPLFVDNDVNDLERMNAIVSNLNHLNESGVSVRYNAYGVLQTSQLKIYAGTTDCNNPNGISRTRWISVPGLTPGTRPVGQATWAGVSGQREAIVSIARRAGGSTILDHTGLQVHIRYVLNTTNKLTGPNFINWMLIGY